MAGPQRQTAPIEVVKFTGGLRTDISPLNSSQDIPGFASEIENFILNIDGSIERRLGMDYEDNHVDVTTSIANADTEETAFSTFKWINAGGNPEKSLSVIQVGNEIKIFDLDTESISNGVIYTKVIPNVSRSVKFSFAVVDGIMVLASKQKDIYLFQYDSGTITFSTTNLLIRDMFGVEDVINGEDLTSGSGIQTRPVAQVQTHIYNLRNQSWGVIRRNASGDLSDPFRSFRGISLNPQQKFPSNSDTVTEALYPDATASSNPTADRFFAADLYASPIGTTSAPKGYFIIDAMERGASRIAEENKNGTRMGLNFPITSLPQDKTPGGAATIAEFAGRIFYGGFSGEIINGDIKSPRLSSYILFSKVVDSPQDINVCYQAGDPTSKDAPDVIATDGGFIRINGAYGIQALVNLGGSLVVIAANGVWRIVGGADNGFTATQYIVEKLSNNGCSNNDSIVIVDNSVIYWGEDAIYYLHPDQFGSYVVENISIGSIQSFYDEIPLELKNASKGAYDNFERKARWLYNNRITDTGEVMELVFDIPLKAFCLNRIMQTSNTFPRPISPLTINAYRTTIENDNVLIGVDNVIADTDNVIIQNDVHSGEGRRELAYLVISSISPTVKYSFASYHVSNWRDWLSVDNVGIDASAYAIATHISGGDNQRDKALPYLSVYLRKTETGFTLDDNGDYMPVGGSSCKVQVRWDWTDSSNSNKWGREFQAYRHNRLWFPNNITDEFNDGYSIVKTKNKIRGGGHTLCIRYATEADKNFHLYGWSMIFSEAGNV